MLGIHIAMMEYKNDTGDNVIIINEIKNDNRKRKWWQFTWKWKSAV